MITSSKGKAFRINDNCPGNIQLRISNKKWDPFIQMGRDTGISSREDHCVLVVVSSLGMDEATLNTCDSRIMKANNRQCSQEQHEEGKNPMKCVEEKFQ